MLDFYGREIKVGNLVVYGKSNRHDPLMVGEIVEIDEDVGHWGEITIHGVKNSKAGTLSGFKINQRIVILPDSYKDYHAK